MAAAPNILDTVAFRRREARYTKYIKRMTYFSWLMYLLTFFLTINSWNQNSKFKMPFTATAITLLTKLFIREMNFSILLLKLRTLSRTGIPILIEDNIEVLLHAAMMAYSTLNFVMKMRSDCRTHFMRIANGTVLNDNPTESISCMNHYWHKNHTQAHIIEQDHHFPFGQQINSVLIWLIEYAPAPTAFLLGLLHSLSDINFFRTYINYHQYRTDYDIFNNGHRARNYVLIICIPIFILHIFNMSHQSYGLYTFHCCEYSESDHAFHLRDLGPTIFKMNLTICALLLGLSITTKPIGLLKQFSRSISLIGIGTILITSFDLGLNNLRIMTIGASIMWLGDRLNDLSVDKMNQEIKKLNETYTPKISCTGKLYSRLSNIINKCCPARAAMRDNLLAGPRIRARITEAAANP